MTYSLPNYRTVLFHALMGLILLFVLVKGCDNTVPNGKVIRFPDVTKSARMFNGSFIGDEPIDTTKKPKQVVQSINHDLVLRGSDTLFNVLWLQIISPQDVTPRNLSILENWVKNNTKQDTTLKK